ncbi:hypothetical protein D9M71_166780 [compost metagenome]
MQAGVVADLVVDDRAYPAHALFVAAIGDVVVLEAPALVDLHGIADRVQDRRAPVRAVFLVFLVLKGQGVAEPGRQVAEDGKRGTGCLAFIAVHVAVAARTADIQASKMVRVRAIAQGMVDPKCQLRGVVAAVAHAAFHGLLFAAGQFGDVVDRTAHGPGAIQERRWPADQLHAVIDPGIHWSRGTAVAHADAVVELGDLVLGKTAVRHKAAKTGVGRRVDAGHAVDHVLGVPGPALLDDRAVGDTDRGRRFAGREAQA